MTFERASSTSSMVAMPYEDTRPAYASISGLLAGYALVASNQPHAAADHPLHRRADRGALRDPEGRRPDRDPADCRALGGRLAARRVADALAGTRRMAAVPADDGGRAAAAPGGLGRRPRHLRRRLPDHAGIPDRHRGRAAAPAPHTRP